ncbi:MAG: TrkA family potassium uptake protein [Dehalococcoidia bacterium]|nr:TrkA family potassium uptake protein [Dehalococcoidia bacterium]MDD5495121.1 TrkA family potassium uptake protein [Dehalococcoidia bacterium]
MKPLYIVIIGGGNIGYYLGKALLGEGHEVLIIEKDARKCERLEDELGSCCMRGDGCETAMLSDAGLNRADVLIATTAQDEDNLVACQVAKYRFKVPRTIALVNNPSNDKIFTKLGVDASISVTNTILEHVEQEIPAHPLIHLLTMSGQMEEVVELLVARDSPAVGKSIAQLRLPADTTVALVMRDGERPRIPGADTLIRENDRIIALTTPSSEKTLQKAVMG